MESSAFRHTWSMADRISTKLTSVRCSAEGETAAPLSIAIKKGHVRRAIRAADLVNAEAKHALTGETERGVLLMTAVLLVERLASGAGCDPNAVLERMADCYAFKRRFAGSLKERN
jgi:hypothetical protein